MVVWDDVSGDDGQVARQHGAAELLVDDDCGGGDVRVVGGLRRHLVGSHVQVVGRAPANRV